MLISKENLHKNCSCLSRNAADKFLFPNFNLWKTVDIKNNKVASLLKKINIYIIFTPLHEIKIYFPLAMVSQWNLKNICKHFYWMSILKDTNMKMERDWWYRFPHRASWTHSLFSNTTPGLNPHTAHSMRENPAAGRIYLWDNCHELDL